MANMSDYLEINLLNCVFNQTAYIPPVSLHLALFLNTSGQASVNLEAGTLTDEVPLLFGYARKIVTTSFNLATGTSGLVSNTNVIQFSSASGGSWGTVTHAAILDESDNVLVWGQLTGDKPVGDGDTFSFPATDLDITFA